MTCGAPHPERPLTCEADGTHADHLAWTPEGFVYWPNEGYVAPPPPDTRRQRSNARDRFLEAAGQVEPERRVHAVARAGDPETSWEAARSLGDLTDAQEEVLAALRQGGPMMDEQLLAYMRAADTKQTSSGVRTRRGELADVGLVVFTETWGTNSKGNRSRIWAAANTEAVEPTGEFVLRDFG